MGILKILFFTPSRKMDIFDILIMNDIWPCCLWNGNEWWMVMAFYFADSEPCSCCKHIMLIEKPSIAAYYCICEHIIIESPLCKWCNGAQSTTATIHESKGFNLIKFCMTVQFPSKMFNIIHKNVLPPKKFISSQLRRRDLRFNHIRLKSHMASMFPSWEEIWFDRMWKGTPFFGTVQFFVSNVMFTWKLKTWLCNFFLLQFTWYSRNTGRSFVLRVHYNLDIKWLD